MPASLIPGKYAVAFEKPGFKKTVVKEIDLHVEAITVDGKMQVGGTSTTVSVDCRRDVNPNRNFGYP